MADDDGGDWFGGDDDTPAAEEAAPAAAGGGEAAPAGGAQEGGAGDDAAAAGGAPAEESKEPAEDEYLDPDKLLLCKHWIRPKFLQYKYMYDYRHNYYNDVIDYLDKKQKGLSRDIPHPQTWAERALRTYTSHINRTEKFRREVEDTKLVTKTRLSGMFHISHSKNYINRRYSSILV